MNNFIAWYKQLSNKPWFVAFEGMFVGTMFTQLQAMYEAGHVDFTWKTVTHMALGAAIGSAMAVWKLYQPQPQPKAGSNNSNQQQP